MTGVRVQRVAAYAVIIRDGAILLSRLSPKVTRHEQWTLPGGGLDHGEDPRAAVVREVYEETGLPVEVSAAAHVFNLHLPHTWRGGRRVDAHSLRIVYRGRVPPDGPPPRVVEVDGSTIEAAWKPLAGVQDGSVPTVSLVQEALAAYRPPPVQRLAAYALVTRESSAGPEVLLTRISSRGHHAGAWTLPGGGVDHGESPADAVVREVAEECGLRCTTGAVLAVDDVVVRGNAPDGTDEDFHGVHLIYAARLMAGPDGPGSQAPVVREVDGTTDAAAWVPIREVLGGERVVLDVVRTALVALPAPGQEDVAS